MAVQVRAVTWYFPEMYQTAGSKHLMTSPEFRQAAFVRS